jgi:hypothetical protein
VQLAACYNSFIILFIFIRKVFVHNVWYKSTYCIKSVLYGHVNLIKILQYHNKVDNLLLHVLYVYIGRAIIIISVIISISGGLESKHYSTCTRNGVYVYSCARTRTHNYQLFSATWLLYSLYTYEETN